MDYNKYALLKLYVANPELKALYVKAAKEHNEKVKQNYPYFDAGFDLFVPSQTTFPHGASAIFIDHQVKAEMSICLTQVKPNHNFDCLAQSKESIYEEGYQGTSPTGFYVYPRSSLSKTPLMLANHVGVIDAGYRGWLIGAFRSLVVEYTVEASTRLLQICSPELLPICVIIVDNETDLQMATGRGEGGFGSTGK